MTMKHGCQRRHAQIESIREKMFENILLKQDLPRIANHELQMKYERSNTSNEKGIENKEN